MMGSSFLFHISWSLFHLLCFPSWLWEQRKGRALPQLSYCLKEVHWQLHLIDSFIIALLMMTFPILSVQLFPPPPDFNCWLFRISRLWFDEGANRVIASLIHTYCPPLSPGRPVWLRLSAEQQIISREEATDILTHQQKAVTEDDTTTHGPGHQHTHSKHTYSLTHIRTAHSLYFFWIHSKIGSIKVLGVFALVSFFVVGFILSTWISQLGSLDCLMIWMI